MARILKVTGNGNHFLLIDLRRPGIRHDIFKKCRTSNRAKVAKILCDPYQSVGADGLLFLENSSRAALKWDFYNADGSRANMCGNAARCVGLYELKRIRKQTVNLETRAGIVSLSILKNKFIEVCMPAIKSEDKNEFVRVAGHKVQFLHVDTGVPHAVVKLKQLKNVDKYAEIVDNIRALRQYKKAGVNVTFFASRSSTSINSLTYERGVPGFTQACGTGAVAAAYAFSNWKPSRSNKSGQRISVHVPGGPLIVDFSAERPLLSGPARIIAEIELRD
jgi:diaminopimelate epimerase